MAHGKTKNKRPIGLDILLDDRSIRYNVMYDKRKQNTTVASYYLHTSSPYDLK